MNRSSTLAASLIMLFVAGTSSAADVTVQAYLDHKDDPSAKEQIDSYFLGAVNAWAFASDTVSSVTGKQLFCVADNQHLNVHVVRALVEARIAMYYKDSGKSELHPVIFEALVDNFRCGNLSLFPTLPSTTP